jgi:hypothetical protein
MLARRRQLMALDASMTCPHPISLKNSNGSNQETLHRLSYICLPLIPFSYLTDRQEQLESGVHRVEIDLLRQWPRMPRCL